MVTSCGTITIQLDTTASNPIPNSVAFLVQKKFYDGLTFHRIIADFVLQGGDPNGNGSGGPGYTVVGKVPPGYHYALGDVAMAKTQVQPSGAAGSQFFVISGRAGRGPADRLRPARTRGGHDVARDDQEDRELRDRLERAGEAHLHLVRDARQGVARAPMRALILQHIACEPPGAFAEVMARARLDHDHLRDRRDRPRAGQRRVRRDRRHGRPDERERRGGAAVARRRETADRRGGARRRAVLRRVPRRAAARLVASGPGCTPERRPRSGSCRSS